MNKSEKENPFKCICLFATRETTRNISKAQKAGIIKQLTSAISFSPFYLGMKHYN